MPVIDETPGASFARATQPCDSPQDAQMFPARDLLTELKPSIAELRAIYLRSSQQFEEEIGNASSANGLLFHKTEFSVWTGIPFFPIASYDQLVVLIGGFDQRNSMCRILLDTCVDDRVVDRNVEQIVIAVRGRAIGLPTIRQSPDELVGQSPGAHDTDTHSGSVKTDRVKIMRPPGGVLPVGPPSSGVERQR
jgi:hypothetical protein